MNVLSIRDAAKRLGVSATMVHKAIEAGLISAQQVGQIKVVSEEALQGMALTFEELEPLFRARKAKLQSLPTRHKETHNGPATGR